MKYYEILPTHTETPRNATRKIANLYIEFNYHILTWQKKIPLLLNRSVHIMTNKLTSSWNITKLWKSVNSIYTIKGIKYNYCKIITK